MFANVPDTFIEPGVAGKWIFDKPVASRIAAYRAGLRKVSDPTLRRLLRVLLGGVLVSVSNVTVSGKGRRYRGSWEKRRSRAIDLDEAFCTAVEHAVGDIVRHANRAEPKYTLLRGDCRHLIKTVDNIDIAVFSPPYPNSFDYTDVYNVELWALGYLDGYSANARLRANTLSSHVQVKRNFHLPPSESPTLTATLASLKRKRSKLWNPWIPDMIGSYFAEMTAIIREIALRLPYQGQIWMVVGDSRYAGVTIPVARIFVELAPILGCKVVLSKLFRSMRSSPQQGGRPSLGETLLVLGRL
jgi:hypothetical protein